VLSDFTQVPPITIPDGPIAILVPIPLIIPKGLTAGCQFNPSDEIDIVLHEEPKEQTEKEKLFESLLNDNRKQQYNKK
jgi:hypothetical protein